jgi:hypothetical protein
MLCNIAIEKVLLSKQTNLEYGNKFIFAGFGSDPFSSTSSSSRQSRLQTEQAVANPGTVSA